MVQVAAIQLSSGPDKESNRRAASSLVADAALAGAVLVVLPEMFNCIGPGQVLRDGAEPFDGPTLAWARAEATTHHVWLVAGSFVERRSDGGRANTSVLVSPTGEIVASYRKVHLFDCAVPGAEFRESDVTEPGEELVVAGLRELHPHAVVGFSICYDLRFPELFRQLALDGATILVLPAAFTARTGPPHWEILLRARAIENQCFVIAAGQAGERTPGLAWHGHSMIVDPWGVVLGEAVTDEPQVVSADLDFARLTEVRAVLPSLSSRRPNAYRPASRR